MKHTNPVNPKDAIADGKIPMGMWPKTASALGALVLLDGALRYGRLNWRAMGARASVYNDAIERHLAAWYEGEDMDPESGLPHLAHILACAEILVDSQANGNLVDDRQFPGGYRRLADEVTPHVRRLKELRADKDPKHFTIADAAQEEEPG